MGKISVQPHTTLCIQFLDRENNDKNNRLPLGKSTSHNLGFNHHKNSVQTPKLGLSSNREFFPINYDNILEDICVILFGNGHFYD